MKSGTISHFLHVDLDAFFASVEQLDNPSYRGKPVIVGGLPGDRRSVVSTASYEARKFGVHSAMPTAEAYRLCPQGIFVHGRMQRYHELSAQIMDIFREYSPDVDQMSVDEAFVDLTGTEALFGEPSETAKRLKKEVKDKTGLTVSAGLASSKYIAKIASALSKPDGFCEVQTGTEEKFMLSLPLNKVWGIGSKTLSRINGAGIFTTRDVYERSEQLLCVLFGESTGTFLYNAVRGKEAETFSRNSSSRSLSAETTFSYDITDTYTAETALMELSHTVMFRLLREGFTSRTAVIKLRYDDFSTVSIRETGASDITSIDDLYARACSLFERKYENGRSIRLLGVGAENLEDSRTARQQELFDFGENKKQAVERAIINLEKKHPEVKIHKARLLDPSKFKAVLFFAVLSALFLCPQNLTAETNTAASGAGSIVIDESAVSHSVTDLPESLFNYQAGNSNVEFLANGYWEAKLLQTTSASFGYGNPFVLSFGIPVFKQNVDLSLWFLLNKSWFFKASFADEFNKNTVAAGYHGHNTVKEVLIANRGIVFPSTYSISLFGRGIGGGDNQAPGLSASFEDSVNEKWHADTVIRYDMLAEHDATFYGKNSVSTISIALSDWLTGQLFVLPSADDVSAVEAVYVQSSSGTYSDSSGRTYKKLSSSQYALLPARCMVIIASDAGGIKKNNTLPRIILTFSSSGSIPHIKNELGTYGTADSPGSGFLGNVQSYFGSSSENPPDVKDYAYSDAAAEYYGLFTTISSSTGLLIQSPAGFSPFACAYRYDCGITTASDAAVVSASTEKSSSEYSAVISDNDITFVSSDFFSDTHTYSDVYLTDASSAAAVLKPSVRYPLADASPGFYLGYNDSGNLKLHLRTYTPVSRYDIGTDAAAGSVSVYKNGILDQAATYDSESGTVTLSTSVADTDKIYITWYEDTTSSDNGAVAAAAGFSWNFLPELTGDAAISSRWSLALKNKFADESESKTGFVSLAAGLSYNKNGFSAENASMVSLETENVTGCYRILGMNDESSETYYLGSSDGVVLPSDFAPILNKRADSTDATLPLTLDADKNCTSGTAGGTTITGISGYAVPVEASFTGSSSSDSWAAASININGGSLLSSGTQFTFALKTADTAVTGYDVYLQLGVYASDDLSDEVRNKIPTWKISDAAAEDVQKAFYSDGTGADSNGWQNITVLLTDYDRARFSKYHDMRLVIVKSSNYYSSNGKSPCIYSGPYETNVQDMFTSQNSTISVTTRQTADSSVPGNSRFNSSTNYAEVMTWKNSADTAPTDDSALSITAARYFTETDIAPYETVNMYFSYYGKSAYSNSSTQISNEAFTFILDSGAESIDESGSTAVRVVLNQQELANLVSTSSRSYHLLSVNLIDKKVSVDDSELPSGSYTLQVNTSVVPSRIKLIFDTAAGSSVYKTGELAVDELYCDGLTPHFLLGNITKTSYKKDGTIIQAGSFPLLENVSLLSSATESASIGTKSAANNTQTVAATAAAAATVATMALSGDAAFSSAESGAVSNAGYSAATTHPLFGIVSFSGAYRFDHTGTSLEHADKVTVNLSPLYVPLTLNAYASSTGSLWSLNQKSGAAAELSFAGLDWSTSLKGSADVTQKILPSAAEAPTLNTDSFTGGWADSAALAYSSGSNAATLRTNDNIIRLSTQLSFISLAPQFIFETVGKYTSSSSVLYTDATSFTTRFPFRIRGQTLSLEWIKKGGGVSLYSTGGNYISDYETLFLSQKSRSWYYSSWPFYDMLSTDLSKAVLSDTSMSTTSADSLFYSTCYTASWSRPLSASHSDFYIPSSLSVAVERDIRTSEKISDIYQLKTIAVINAFNIFGSESSTELFKWYKQDEYNTSLTVAVKIPKENLPGTTFQLSAYTQENFYITDSDILKTGLEISFETDGDWSSEGTVVWKRAGRSSLIPDLIKLFRKSYDPSTAGLKRTSSIDITFSSEDSVFKQVYILVNSLDAKLSKYFTFSCGATGSCTNTQDTSILLSLTLQLGGKVQF
jgi:nucleotidyltransferase/DNA polymerase involved in DNA repair